MANQHKKCHSNGFETHKKIEGYKLAKRVAKRAVSVAKDKAYDDLYQRLDTKEGEKQHMMVSFGFQVRHRSLR